MCFILCSVHSVHPHIDINENRYKHIYTTHTYTSIYTYVIHTHVHTHIGLLIQSRISSSFVIRPALFRSPKKALSEICCSNSDEESKQGLGDSM